MQVRYRYRIYPSPGQRQSLARVFGCARVVYNDCLRLRDECHARGEKISDTEVRRRVVTLAKPTPERMWLSEVASVALVQACQDARRAYRNWFDSMAGRRKGPQVAHPRPRRKHGRQSVRLTRNGFALHGQRLYVAKVGDVAVEWSRDLPSAPSSVSVVREPDGRFYASFVVERAVTPLPACGREVGIDLGLASLVVTSDGEVIANPRFMRAKVRDNQAVYAEDLCVSGLARTRLAKSVADAGWSQLLRCIEEKAVQYGREFGRIGRFEPTSQVCSACGLNDGPKPLSVRAWQCAGCGLVHDRDVNAARNILAAGRADRLNACGAGVRPPSPVAAGVDTGTHRSAA
jgi:putative transposase